MAQWQKWKQDLDLFQNMKSAFIVEGNVHDLQVWINRETGRCSAKTLNDFLYDYLKELGYEIVVFYNKVDGFFNARSLSDVQAFLDIPKRIKEDTEHEAYYRNENYPDKLSFQINPKDENISCFEQAADIIRYAMRNITVPVAVVFDMANISISSVNMLADDELSALSRLFLATKRSEQASNTLTGKMLKNCVYYIVEKANDLPAWFYLNNPYTKNVTVTKIDKELRKCLIENNRAVFCDFQSLTQQERETLIDKLAALTEGFSTADLLNFCMMCSEKGFPLKDAKKAVDFFKYGISESHWDKLNGEVLKRIPEILEKRVKGQPEAIQKTTQVILRASLGLTGIQKNSGSRPKGILFFAGPTGTGKTELAKSIAEMIFDDESFITRFDMSEYQQPHSDQKLLGAPPGYVGYDAGGQLTNAVKEKPFNILLFDEIEKAHPSILDKFLQILDDGRMTDSFGETVYFSESLIIFTSNLGVTKQTADGTRCPNISIDMDYEQVKDRIENAIKEYFIHIGRPEILNRIGNNIVVFNYIKDEQIIHDIVELQLEKVIKNLSEEKKVRLVLSDNYKKALYAKVSLNTENGARGIGNTVEEYLVNQLTYIFIRHDLHDGDTVIINGLIEGHQEEKLDFSIEKASANNPAESQVDFG